MNKLLKRYLNYRHSSNSYSHYPTDYKKYEFRTGTFKGFFVSSVEFCKHIKFDNRKEHKVRNNTTGTEGPQGLPGSAGATGSQGVPDSPGLQGPPGITNINGFNFYSIIGNLGSTSLEDRIGNSTAVSLPGDIAVSGEYNVTSTVEFRDLIHNVFW